MERKFSLSCESTVDLPFAYVNGRDIPVLFYTYTVDGAEYVDDMLRDPDALPRFYQMLSEGKLPTTSQLDEYQYEAFFEQQLEGGDLLHIAFGYGMLVDDAADMRDSGCTLEETAGWVEANRKNIHHQFFSTQLDHYRRSGRMSGATAMIATILGICPIMRLDDKGGIIAYSKVRGRARAIQTTLDTMERHAQGGRNYAGKCWICHSQCPEDAQKTKQALLERFLGIKGEVRICDIGTIIASHCGPGTVAVFFHGDERQADK